MFTGKRILVTGCPGSGKSVLSARLQKITGLKLIHLDNVWWRPDRTHISREEFDRELARMLEEPEWIIDGDYSRTYETRIRSCDSVIFLDYDEELCMEGIIRRTGSVRPDIPWTEQKPDPELIRQVRDYHDQNRPVLLSLMERYKEKQWIVFASREQADRWLSQLENASGGEENYVYLLRCKDHTLYCGWTTDLTARMKTHNSGKGAKYTRSRLPVELVYYETYSSRHEALARERQIKKMSREQKLRLIKLQEAQAPAAYSF